MKSSAKNIKLTSYDDIFQTDEEKEDASREKIEEIPLRRSVRSAFFCQPRGGNRMVKQSFN